MKCPKCGTETDSNFCPHCGAKIEDIYVKKTINKSVESNHTDKPKFSGLSIGALIVSFLGGLGIVGVILGIVDLVKNKEHKHGLSIAAIIIGALMFAATIGIKDSDKQPDANQVVIETQTEDSSSSSETEELSSTEEKDEVVAEPSPEPIPTPEPEPAISKDEFIASCEELDYKKMARNPDDFVGKNYKFTAIISSAREGGMFTGYQKYYISYAFDMNKAEDWVKKGYADNLDDAKYIGMDYDQCVWLLDNRDIGSSDYVKILEDDIVTVYGTFTGMQETKNSLTKETGEEVSLDIKFVDLLNE